jgi:hypothetical protein
MITELEIFNLALCQLGLQPVAGLTDTSDKRVQAYKITYKQAVSFVLSELQMFFSKKTDPLNLLSDQTMPGYDYVYQYPGDALLILDVMDSDGEDDTDWKVKRIGALSDAVIVSNMESAYCEYVQSVGETSNYPSHFIECLKFKIASDCAVYLTGDNQKMAINVKMYTDIKNSTVSADSLQSVSSIPDVSTYTDARE